MCRYLLSVVFIFSGFIKANDILGFQYKIQDYFVAFGLDSLNYGPIPFLMALLISMLEFCLGVYLFFGIRRKSSSILSFVMMAIMTPITFWLALTNHISECGCFGDVVILTNWETFLKNIILFIAALSVLRWKKQIITLISSRFDWLIGLYTVVYIFVFALYTYRELPLFDFRPFHIGADIKKEMEYPSDAKAPVYETSFILEKNGIKKEFSLDNYPDSTWTYIETKNIVKEKGYLPPITDFFIERQIDGEDITDAVLNDSNYTVLLVAPFLEQADDSSIDLINELYDYCVDNGYNFYCLTSSNNKDINRWKENTGAEYPFAISDEVTLKTIVRSNPGIVLLKDGIVINKWSVNNIPNEYQLGASLDKLPLGHYSESTLSHKIMLALAWFLVPLLVFSLIDVVWGKFRKNH